MQNDIEIIPPVAALTRAYAIGPAGIVTVALVPPGDGGYYWFSFMADVEWYVLFGPDPVSIVDPNPAAVTPAAGACFRVPADFELQRKLHAKYGTLKVAALEDGILRIHVASHPGGGEF